MIANKLYVIETLRKILITGKHSEKRKKKHNLVKTK